MEAAFHAGADIVEFDLHITKDEQFAVFHDWTLDCRTNAAGVTRDYNMAELKLTEVLTHFPEKSLLIDIKSSDPKEGELLAQYLSNLSKQRRSQLAVYGGGRTCGRFKRKVA